MLKRTFSGIMLALLLIGLLALAFDIRPVIASGTIYIRADGSVDPPSAPIQRDGNVYTFINNIHDEIVVEKDNIEIDGNGYAIDGVGRVGRGITLSSISNVTVWNIKISDFAHGIYVSSSINSVIADITLTNNGFGISLLYSSTNVLYENTIRNSAHGTGIWLFKSQHNTVSRNKLSKNGWWAGIALVESNNNMLIDNIVVDNGEHGIYLHMSSNNEIVCNNASDNKYGIHMHGSHTNRAYHNNFYNNTYQGHVEYSQCNVWDDGYPSGGNYWSDYSGKDFYKGRYQNILGSDGIGDTPYVIDGVNDRRPLMNPWGTGTPAASFTWDPLIPKVGEPITLDASSSTPNGGTITEYEWDFGNEEYAAGQIVTRTYSSSGTYIVTLNVTDSEGLWDTEQRQIQVVQPHGPKAEFTAIPETTLTGEPIKFDASASLPGWNGTHEMPITEYRWDFGGGIEIGTSTPILYYSFISPGIYYVILTVYAPGATPETDSVTHKVTVTSVPVGGYSVPIKGYTAEKPLTLYLAIVAILTASFTNAKRRKKQQN